MLAHDVRMRTSAEFASATRGGQRVARPSLVLHSRLVGPPSRSQDEVLVGFVVSKAVGNAVTRNRVKRRLRHLVADRLSTCPAGLRLVLRALPPAAAEPQRLVADFQSAWRAAETHWGGRAPAER